MCPVKRHRYIMGWWRSYSRQPSSWNEHGYLEAYLATSARSGSLYKYCVMLMEKNKLDLFVHWSAQIHTIISKTKRGLKLLNYSGLTAISSRREPGRLHKSYCLSRNLFLHRAPELTFDSQEMCPFCVRKAPVLIMVFWISKCCFDFPKRLDLTDSLSKNRYNPWHKLNLCGVN